MQLGLGMRKLMQNQVWTDLEWCLRELQIIKIWEFMDGFNGKVKRAFKRQMKTK